MVVLVAALFLIPASTAAQPRWLVGGHAGSVRAVVFSPDGKVFASAGDDATVKLWSTNGALLRTLTTHPYQATALAFSPDGTNLAVGTYAGGYRGGYSGLGRVLLWRADGSWSSANPTLTRVLTNHLGKVTALAFSADGLKLASGGVEGSNVVRQVSTGGLLMQWAAYNTAAGPAAVTSLAFSPAGFLASGCEDDTLCVWDASGTQVWNTGVAHASNVTAVAFSPDGTLLATAGLDQTIHLWSATNWAKVNTLTGQGSGVTSLSFSPDGTTLAAGDLDGFIKLWHLDDGTCAATMAAHTNAVTSLAFSPDGTRLISGGEDHHVKQWSPAGGSPVSASGSHNDLIKAVAVSPDGSLCASVGNDRVIQLRCAADGAVTGVLAEQPGGVNAIAFSPDNTLLASAGGPLDPAIKLWRLNDLTLLRTISAGSNGAMALAFSPDGLRLAAGGDFDEPTIQLWNTTDGSLVQTLAGHSNGVTALAFDPRGNRLVSGGRRFDHTVKVWDLANGGLVRTFIGHANTIEAVAFSPDGDSVASGSNGTNALKVWKVSDGTSLDFGAETNAVFFVAFSPDGSTLASAGNDAVKLWNVATGSLSQIITQETSRVSCLAYSPNGNWFIYGREDATLALSTNSFGALGQPPLEFNRIAPGNEGSIRLEAHVQPMTRYVIQTSSNLRDWTWLTSAASDTNELTLIDLAAGAVPLRFYRAFTPP